MTDSTLLGLPYMDAAQSQKHVTHNEALALLDISLQIALDTMNVTVPPGSPAEGLAPGTRWADIPEDWICPDCGVGKSEFEMIDITK